MSWSSPSCCAVRALGNQPDRQGKGDLATCTYPDAETVLRCIYNPDHGSGSEALIIPAPRRRRYTVSVAWPVEGWTVSGADDEEYSARDVSPRR